MRDRSLPCSVAGTCAAIELCSCVYSLRNLMALCSAPSQQKKCSDHQSPKSKSVNAKWNFTTGFGHAITPLLVRAVREIVSLIGAYFCIAMITLAPRFTECCARVACPRSMALFQSRFCPKGALIVRNCLLRHLGI